MAKRRLTKQQRERIKANQAEKAILASELGAKQEGRLIAHYGTYVDIEDQSEAIHRCHLRQSMEPLVVGDRVVWQSTPSGQGVVIAHLSRETMLFRHDSHGQEKLVAANVDQIIITCAVEPIFSLYLLDCYLAAAELTGIRAVVLLNKVDLLDDEQREALEQTLELYKAINYQVLMISSESGEALSELTNALKNHTSVFVGQSGVGKSSLIQHFVSKETLAVGHISEQQKLGRHTTTTSKLYPLKEGGSIIDSPGVREFGLGKVSSRTLLQAFVEFKPFEGQCKFRNCQHDNEPDCALKAALKAGKIEASRMASFCKLFGE